ncbi:MAG: ABC transporter ATP-binding protein [Planctomycetota bacterium]
MNDIAIESHGLRKTFPGDVKAVDGLDVQIPAGTVYGLIGRNGAGKTTLIRMLMGLLRPTAGRAALLGKDMWTADEAHRGRVTYVSQELRLPRQLSVRQLGGYLAGLYRRWDQPYADSLCGQFELAVDRPLGLMSGGEQRKAAVLLAFAARPEVVLLDEPAAGMDPIARRQLIDEIVDMLTGETGCTVLFSTHIIADLERVAEVVGMMDRGRIVTEAPLEDLRSRMRRVQVIFDNGQVPEGFSIPGAVRSTREGPVVTAVVNVEDERQLDSLRSRQGVRVNVFPLGLEDVFVELFGPQIGRELQEVQA